MGRFARVTSVGILQTMATAIQRFRGEAAGAIDDMEIEIRRALEWIHHDRKEYWAQELRRSWEGVSQARLQLQQARLSRKIVGHEPSCVDEQRALERAKRRLENAQKKVEAVKHFAFAIDRAVDDFRRSRAQFVTWLETDMPLAISALNRMSESLESYISIAVPTDPNAPAVGSDTQSADGGEEEAKTPADERVNPPPPEAAKETGP
jgi:hypothetical protein